MSKDKNDITFDRDAFWDNFQKLLLKYGTTMMEVQTAIGKQGSYIYAAKCNRALPSIDILWKIADALGCSLDELVGRVPPVSTNDPETQLIAMLKASPTISNLMKKVIDNSQENKTYFS